MTDLPDLPDPEPGSREHGDRLALDMCATIEQEMVPMLEAMGEHEKARRYRQTAALIRAVTMAETVEEIDTLERLDALIWNETDEPDDD